MALTEDTDTSIALSSIILALFIECFLGDMKWLFNINDCPPECKIPVELKQDESKQDSSQQKNAEIVYLGSFDPTDSLFGWLKES